MRIEALAVQLRPRSMPEAADLGVRLVQAHAASVWGSFVPAYLVVVGLALATLDLALWAPPVVIFWLKPWCDRTLLFSLSRAVFGQSTSRGDVWRQRRTVWLQHLVATLTVARLSPWRAYMQPVEQLEGLHGRALWSRRRLLLSGQHGRAGAVQWAFSNIELALLAGVLSMVQWFTPEGIDLKPLSWLFGDSAAAAATATVVYAAIVLLLEPYFVAAGFAMYLNRRVHLEAWDIEREFRRALAERAQPGAVPAAGAGAHD
jgi:hypothetical protein